MILSVLSAGVLASMLLIALYNLAAAPRLERAPLPRRAIRVSLLVPVRNEAASLVHTLACLGRLGATGLEILMLDDQSEDGSGALLEQAARRQPAMLRVLRGSAPPAGWLGKSWACHQLAEAASGDILIFCDADVLVQPDAIARTVGAMESQAADALTALPRQRMVTWTERAVVPLVVHLPVLALLPLPLAARLRAPALSMGNGQWLAFRREAYQACGGHAAVRDRVLEDVALARRVKQAGFRLLPVVSATLLEVRMYAGPAAVREGFRKNLYALCGAHPAPFGVALTLFALTAIYPWVGLLAGTPGALVPALLLLALRGCGAALLGHGIASIALHPVGSLLLVALGADSALGQRRGTLRWKGRLVAPPTG